MPKELHLTKSKLHTASMQPVLEHSITPPKKKGKQENKLKSLDY